MPLSRRKQAEVLAICKMAASRVRPEIKEMDYSKGLAYFLAPAVTRKRINGESRVSYILVCN